MNNKKNIILSIHPRWVDKIINGQKTIELRKRLPKNINTIYVYATRPISKIIGIIYIKNIFFTDIYSLYDITDNKHCCSLEEYLDYFKNKEFGYGIEIQNIELFKKPIPLKNPPQNFMYVPPNFQCI
jgi:predicted transcriptional regulator